MIKRLWLILLMMAVSIPALSAQETEDDTMTESNMRYTYHQASGNRFVTGTGTFPNVTTQDALVGDTPAWVIGNAGGWRVQLVDQRVVNIRDDSVQASETPYEGVLALLSDDNFLIPDGMSLLSHPVLLPNVATLYITETGNLAAQVIGGTPIEIGLGIQLDARIVVSDDNRIAVYAGATNERYVHGIMGDDIEGSEVVILQIVDGAFEILERITLTGDAVYEGLSPMWADVNGDGAQDLITTVSDSQSGSRIRAYIFTDEGVQTVDGVPIGRGNRWQHQLVWASFAPDGTFELVEVLTPHIGGVVRFYQYQGDRLEIVAELSGYTSHVIGSRNLDMAVAGDFNGDGIPEIVLPSQDRMTIAGIQRTETGATVVWQLPLNAPVVTNLAAYETETGLALATGLQSGVVRVWESVE
ncbi:MAG: hypothetical protein AAFQ52_11910 [Chloroflexota bacterium]